MNIPDFPKGRIEKTWQDVMDEVYTSWNPKTVVRSKRILAEFAAKQWTENLNKHRYDKDNMHGWVHKVDGRILWVPDEGEVVDITDPPPPIFPEGGVFMRVETEPITFEREDNNDARN